MLAKFSVQPNSVDAMRFRWVPSHFKRWLTKPLCDRLAQRLFFLTKEGPELTKEEVELTTDPLTRSGADEIARNLRVQYRDSPHFKAAVFMFPYGKSGNFCYVVRTNLINGMPPTKPTEIKPPDAELLRCPFQQVAA